MQITHSRLVSLPQKAVDKHFLMYLILRDFDINENRLKILAICPRHQDGSMMELHGVVSQKSYVQFH